MLIGRLRGRGARRGASGCCAPSPATRATSQIMYGIAGERRLPELRARRGCRATRIRSRCGSGNDALAAVPARRLRRGPRPAAPGVRARGCRTRRRPGRWSSASIDVLESAWREPDEGIWEVRGGRQHFTHSKVMAWVGVDRAIRDVELFGFPVPVDRWRALRDEIHARDHVRGVRRRDRLLRPVLRIEGAGRRAASCCRSSGSCSADDPKMVGTVAAIQDRADGRRVRPALRHRARASTVSRAARARSSRAPCWLADCLSLQGHDEQARELFERASSSVRNDVGLLSEEYDVANGRLIGNFPQAFSHVLGDRDGAATSRAAWSDRPSGGCDGPWRVPRVALRGVRR